MKHDTDSTTKNESIAYALGCIETRIAEIARNINEPEQELREWVGILLLSSREGTINRLSTLRGETTKMGRPTRKMEMVNYTHSKSQKKPSNPSHPVTSQKGFKYNGTHWTQQAKNKKKLAALTRARHIAQGHKVNGVAA